MPKKAKAAKEKPMARKSRVIIYTTKTCPWCQKAKEFLKANNVAYIEKDVGEDPEAARELIEKSGQMGVPVLEIDSEIIIGYDEEKIKKALKL